MDGRALSAHLMPELRAHARELLDHYGFVPTLVAIVAGEDPASQQYVSNKRRIADMLGMKSEVVKLTAGEATTQRLLELISGLNKEPRVTGILLQLPLPAPVDTSLLLDAIAPGKDVDALSAGNIVAFYRGQRARFIPCTPRGVFTLLDFYKVPVTGARATVIGRSDIAGKPMTLLLGGRLCNATVTWCHRSTRELAGICHDADILVSCAGANPGDRPFLITAEMVKRGACVVDVGFRRVGPGRFAGDVDFAAVSEIAGWITPNPGGTGPMTVVALMQNLIDAARYHLGLERARYSV